MVIVHSGLPQLRAHSVQGDFFFGRPSVWPMPNTVKALHHMQPASGLLGAEQIHHAMSRDASAQPDWLAWATMLHEQRGARGLCSR